MPHLNVNFSLVTLVTLFTHNDIRFGVYMHDLCVNLNCEIHGLESGNSGMMT